MSISTKILDLFDKFKSLHIMLVMTIVSFIVCIFLFVNIFLDGIEINPQDQEKILKSAIGGKGVVKVEDARVKFYPTPHIIMNTIFVKTGDLLITTKAKRMTVSVSFFSFLFKSNKIKSIEIEDATIDVVTKNEIKETNSKNIILFATKYLEKGYISKKVLSNIKFVSSSLKINDGENITVLGLDGIRFYKGLSSYHAEGNIKLNNNILNINYSDNGSDKKNLVIKSKFIDMEIDFASNKQILTNKINASVKNWSQIGTSILGSSFPGLGKIETNIPVDISGEIEINKESGSIVSKNGLIITSKYFSGNIDIQTNGEINNIDIFFEKIDLDLLNKSFSSIFEEVQNSRKRTLPITFEDLPLRDDFLSLEGNQNFNFSLFFQPRNYEVTVKSKNMFFKDKTFNVDTKIHINKIDGV